MPYRDHKAINNESDVHMREFLPVPRSRLPSLQELLQTPLRPPSLPHAIYRENSILTGVVKLYRSGSSARYS
jgi:hypothetical protein